MYSIKTSYKDMFETVKNASSKSEANEKIFFNMCHISPIKMHLSFSLSNEFFKDDNVILSNPFFKSIGLALTDVQDIVFKLGYFEVKNSVYSWNEVTQEAVGHYKGQVIKQAYSLLLG